MPKILCDKADFESLYGAPIPSDAEFERDLLHVKGEYKGVDTGEESGRPELKIELNDTNRPDTWTPEGIARQLKGCRGEGYPAYDFVGAASGPDHRVEVAPELEGLRPFLGAFVARGEGVSDALLRSLIQTQEKLSETFGHKRKSIAAGIYKMDLVKLPVSYGTVAPDDAGFVPLGEDHKMTPAEILAEHPKGREYAYILEGRERYPILKGADGLVLSMPPVINSADLGQVEVGDGDLFVEFTGTDIHTMTVATNIMAADMADRGFTIEPVKVVYPYDTPWGRELTYPYPLGCSVEVSVEDVTRALGVELDAGEVTGLLERYGLTVEAGDGGAMKVTAPFYRNDLLHPMDVVEDAAICRGYDSFPRVMPTDYTVGRLSALQEFADRTRTRMVGLGFQEMSTPVLTRRDRLVDRMERDGEDLVEIANPMTENFAVVRNSLLPSLLEVEEKSYQAAYPHRLFEAGEVGLQDAGSPLGTTTRRRVAALVAHGEAGFAEIHAILDAYLTGLGYSYRLDAEARPGYFDGRCGAVVVTDEGGERSVGEVGEIAPSVLDAWGVKVPAAAFELDLGALLGG